MSNVMMIVLGMTIVTYIPRLIPFLLVSEKELPRKVEAFLEYVPYTALGALIIPGAITAIEGEPLASCVAMIFAGVYSYFKGGMIVVIVGSMAIVYLMLLI